MSGDEVATLLTQIDVRLQQLGWIRVARVEDERHIVVENPALLNWARAAVERSGLPSEAIDRLLSQTQPDRHWWLLRQFLPIAALQSLDRKLESLIHEETQNHALTRDATQSV